MEDNKYMEHNKYDENVELDLVEIFYILRSKILSIVLAAVVCAGLAAAYAYFVATPVYQATSKIYILSQSTSITSMADIQLGSSLKSDYAELIKSRPVVNTVNNNLGLNRSYSSMLGSLYISNPENTRIIVISFRDSDPDTARIVANEFSIVAKQQISNIMKTDEPTIVEVAVTPTGPIAPNKLKVILLGFLFGGFILSLIYIIRYMTDDSIKDQTEVEKYLGLTVLASIPIDADKSTSIKDKVKKGKANQAYSRHSKK